MSNWTDELKAKAVELYTAENPTPETSVEIVQAVSEDPEFSDFTINGIRRILVTAGVYVAKAPTAAKAASGSTGGGRVSKQGAQDALQAAIEAKGLEADLTIISKLTGKAAQYITTIVTAE